MCCVVAKDRELRLVLLLKDSAWIYDTRDAHRLLWNQNRKGIVVTRNYSHFPVERRRTL